MATNNYFNRFTLNDLAHILEIPERKILENIRHGQLSRLLEHLSTRNLRIIGLSTDDYQQILKYYARVKGSKKALDKLNHDIFQIL